MKPSQTRAIDHIALPALDSARPFGAEFVGLMRVPADGDYAFSVQSDSGADLWVHDNLLIDDDFSHDGSPKSGSVPLRAGWHPIRVDYRHDPSKGACRLEIRGACP